MEGESSSQVGHGVLGLGEVRGCEYILLEMKGAPKELEHPSTLVHVN